MNTTREPLFPGVEVLLSDEDGNALVLISAVRRALRRAGAADGDIVRFTEEATSGDYDHVLATCMRWVNVS